MKNLKWWQWVLIVVIGLAILGKFADEPQTTKSAETARFTEPSPKFKTIAGNSMFAMTFDGQADPEVLPSLARDKCGKLTHCQVLAWTDPEFAAPRLPMTDREVQALAFSYLLNRASGYEQIMWDCRRWKRASQNECLSTEFEKEEEVAGEAAAGAGRTRDP